MFSTHSASLSAQRVSAEQVGMSLFGPYILCVELASMVLLAGLVAAYHLARPRTMNQAERLAELRRREGGER